MKNHERKIFFYDLDIKARNDAPAPATARNVVNALFSLLYNPDGSKNYIFHKRDRDNITLTLRDVVIDEDRDLAILFIGKADKATPAHAYANVDSGGLEVHETAAHQAPEVTAHVIIDLRENPDNPERYLCLLEGVTGLTHRSVVSLVNCKLREIAKADKEIFTRPSRIGAVDRQGNPKIEYYTPRILLIGYISQELVREFENGSDQRITLIRDTLRSSFGERGYFDKTKLSLEIAVAEAAPREGLFGSILGDVQRRARSFNKVKVHFKDPEGLARTVDLDPENGSLEQQRYVFSKLITGITPPLSSMATVEIVDRVAIPMMRMAEDERG